MAQVIEHLPTNLQALCSKPQYHQKNAMRVDRNLPQKQRLINSRVPKGEYIQLKLSKREGKQRKRRGREGS
jgi:hypothetical protein